MNSPSCITPSSHPAVPARRIAAAIGPAATGVAGIILAASLLSACGGSRPEPERPRAAAEGVSASPDPAKGQGVVTFRYSNRSTDANLQVDLGATDISLEMTGRPAEAAREAAALGARSPQGEAKPAGQPPAEPEAGATPREDARAERKQARKPPSRAPADHGPDTGVDEEDQEAAEDAVPQDVTDKVLLGIRKSQEFFYQKRYPEALQMVRSSLEARPTAEGHALAGSVHYMMGATGLARRHWQQALRLNPDMPAVTNMLEKIATPGGRGSPHPRPLAARRKAAAPSPSILEAAGPSGEPPFPDEVAEPISPPVRNAPARAAAPAPSAVPAGPAPAAEPDADEATDAPTPAPTVPVSGASAPAAAGAAPAAAKAVPVPAQSAPDSAGPRATTGSGPGEKPRFPRKTPSQPASGEAPAGALRKDKAP